MCVAYHNRRTVHTLDGLAAAQELGDERGVAASLEGFAGLAAAEGLHTNISAPADPGEHLRIAQSRRSVREVLGPDAFDEAHAEGCEMAQDERVAYVLKGTGLLLSD